MERSVQIPAHADQLRLGYRYRVKDSLPLGTDQLRIEIRNSQGDLLELAPTITAHNDTTQAFSNHYLKHTYFLSEAYAQEQITIRFQSVTDESDAFRIDQVFLAYDATPAASLSVEVDEREESVILDADIRGITLDRFITSASWSTGWRSRRTPTGRS